MQNRTTKTIALCSIFSALALLVLLAGELFPFATYIAPIFAGLLTLPVVCEAGRRAGWLMYAGIALLGLLLAPGQEASILFCAFLGYYPLLRFSLEKLPRLPRLLLKYLLFNVCILAAYWLMLHLFGIAALQQEFASMTGGWPAALLALANVTFAVYDLAIARLFTVYTRVLLPRIRKGIK